MLAPQVDRFAAEFAGHDTERELLRLAEMVLSECVAG
jgi:hypothetical protein